MTQRPLTVVEAYRILDLHGPVGPAALSAAFRRVAKAVHPDSPRGDVVLFRYVVEAYHLLQHQPRPMPLLGAPDTRKPRLVHPAPELVLNPMQALRGGIASLSVEGKPYRARIAPGLRQGDAIRLKGLATVPVFIRAQDGLSVFASDVFYRTKVPSRVLRDGGRIEIQTPLGHFSSWLVPDMPSPTRLRFEGAGLPERGPHPSGEFYVTLEAVQDNPSELQNRHQRFTQLWTGQAVAA